MQARRLLPNKRTDKASQAAATTETNTQTKTNNDNDNNSYCSCLDEILGIIKWQLFIVYHYVCMYVNSVHVYVCTPQLAIK